MKQRVCVMCLVQYNLLGTMDEETIRLRGGGCRTDQGTPGAEADGGSIRG